MRKLVGTLLCSLLRHPPSTWGNRGMEDPLLRMISRPPLPPDMSLVSVTVSCLCGRKMVPFRPRPLD